MYFLSSIVKKNHFLDTMKRICYVIENNIVSTILIFSNYDK